MLAPRKLACAAALIAAVACSSKSDDGGTKTSAAKDAAGTSTPSGKPSPTDARAPAAVDGGFAQLPADPFAPIGVAECDAYIKKQRACVEANAPALIKDQQLDGLGHIATRWRQVAAAGATENLLASCKALDRASEDAVKAWKCTW
jgi:hypothetical protein